MVKPAANPVMHCQNFSSVGFQGIVYLEPKTVSFSNLYFKEGGGVAAATGFYSPQNGVTHDPTFIGSLIYNCNAITGCEAFTDTLYTGNWTNWTGNWGNGQFTWPIEWKYGFNEASPIQNYIYFTTATHIQVTDSIGTASLRKAGAGPHSKMVADQTVNAGALSACDFPKAP